MSENKEKKITDETLGEVNGGMVMFGVQAGGSADPANNQTLLFDGTTDGGQTLLGNAGGTRKPAAKPDHNASAKKRRTTGYLSGDPTNISGFC